MSTLTPELRAEIARHQCEMSGREGMIIRDMELGLTDEQMAAKQNTTAENVKNYVRGTKAMLRGELPTTPSSALKTARGYRYLLGCNLSPELRSYVTSCLRQLKTINPQIREEPLHPGTPRELRTRARPDDTAREPNCPSCHMLHAGECP
jgi:hypothetical protein